MLPLGYKPLKSRLLQELEKNWEKNFNKKMIGFVWLWIHNGDRFINQHVGGEWKNNYNLCQIITISYHVPLMWQLASSSK
jgi:hypothetical protein